MAIRDMVARHSEFDKTKDYIPTPPWATRVLYDVVSPELRAAAAGTTAWDPACGEGYMARTLKEYHDSVQQSDVHDYGTGHAIGNFTKREFSTDAGAIVTNPPYKHLNAFIQEGLDATNRFLALLTRVQALETEGRYDFYSRIPPTQIAFFSNRIPFKTGAVVRKAPKMFFHIWMVWDLKAIRERGALNAQKPPMWIPYDAQQQHERDADYE